MEDLTDIQVKKWIVKEYIGKGTWRCECSECGKERNFRAYHLKNNRVAECTHNNDIKHKFKIDMTHKIVGELEVLEFNNSMGKWKCKCSCGNIVYHTTYELNNNTVKTCGHNSGKLKDLKEKEFGELKPIEYIGNRKWRCKCSCGKITDVNTNDLVSGNTRSCGHIKLNQSKVINLVNQDINEWHVIKYVGNSYWKCKCSCGTVKNIHSYSLRNKFTKNCGGYKHRGKDLKGKTFGELKVLDYMDKNEFSNRSRYENELTNILDNSNIHYEINNKNLIDGYELDIYIPEKKLAIEFNGDYWHSTLFKDKYYHQNKTLACVKNNISLIHIFEHEWLDASTRDKIVSLLLNKVSSNNQETIYARKTKVTIIDNKDCKNFLSKYHLQGYVNSSINIGMYYNNELIGVMTFGVPRFNNNFEYELLRLCWKDTVRVLGGAEKLFNYFISNYKPTSILSYCNISKFNGDVYKKLGFSFDKITEPNYVWVNKVSKEVVTRYKSQKHKLIEKGLGTREETEDEMMQKHGYLKVYDCGNLRFTWSC